MVSSSPGTLHQKRKPTSKLMILHFFGYPLTKESSTDAAMATSEYTNHIKSHFIYGSTN
jgi:hypothetical protein